MARLDPTPEQKAALELFETGEGLVVQAGAGTGKTSTLLMLAERTRRRGQYVAFNRAIVEDAKRRFPGNVPARTMHSLAFGAVGNRFADRIEGTSRMPSNAIASKLGVRHLGVDLDGGRTKVMQPGQLAGLAMRGVRAFCQSADPEPAARHVPYVPGIDPRQDDGSRTYANNRVVADYLVPYMRKAWSDLTDPRGQLPYDMGCYLKQWEMSDPHIAADFVLFDEAQDASPVMLSIIQNQTDAQLVFVGDSCQQIYEFTGAVDALERLPDSFRTFLSQSFRFGPAVAEVANDLLTDLDADLRLRGFDQIDSTVRRIEGMPDATLTRTNAVAMATLLDFQRRSIGAHLVGGGAELVRFAEAAQDLQDGRRTWYPDLACFDTWGEVQDYVDRDPQGDELKLLVELVDEYGAKAIIDAITSMPSEKAAATVISTAHKSKGREWAKVRLAGDFPDGGADADFAAEELRLLYVAVTRAQGVLDIESVPYFRPGVRPADILSTPGALL